jgi:hypothetical protein
MRATLRFATLVLGVVVMTASVHGSEPEKKDTKTPASKNAKAPSGTKDTKTSSGTGTPASHGAMPAAQGATTAKLETAAAAAAAGAPRQGTVTVAATTSAPKQETIEEIVARVKRRLATERTPTRKASPPAAKSATPEPRVTLVWRPYVVWPDELTAPTTDKSPRDADRDRVTLQWESDAR